MELKAGKKTITLVFTTRKIVNISNQLKGKNFEDLYFKAMNENDLDALSKIIYTFAEDAENGAKSFKTSEEVYDFIDEYKAEKDKSYDDIFKEVAEAINNEGFFRTKMNKKQLQEMISNHLLGMNINELIQKSAEKAMSKVAEEQIMNTAI